MSESDKDLKEMMVDAELLYDGRVVHLYRETVKLPNGKISTRDVVRHNGAVAMIPIDADGKIVMVRQYRQAARQILLEIPAGGLEPGENPDDCVSRECQEEIGYIPGRIERIGGIFLAPGYSTEYIHLYIAHDLTPSRLDHDEDEFLQVVRLSLDEAVAMMLDGRINDAKTISALLMFRARNNS